MQVTGAALMADVSNSTPLFERVGEEGAFREINRCLEEMREQIESLGGVFLHSKGDDVLAYFDDADAALAMARAATRKTGDDALKVHAGISWGTMLRLPNDLYGTPVNIAARLASLAKSHEVLVNETLYNELSASAAYSMREVDQLSLKGSSERLKVYSHLAEDPAGETLNFTSPSTAADGSVHVVLTFDGDTRTLTEGGELSLGRASDSDLVISQPWVSRQHATVSVMNGIVVFRDHSTLGSFVCMDQGREIVARRSSVTLIGNGEVSLGAPFSQSSSAVIRYSQTISPDE